MLPAAVPYTPYILHSYIPCHLRQSRRQEGTSHEKTNLSTRWCCLFHGRAWLFLAGACCPRAPMRLPTYSIIRLAYLSSAHLSRNQQLAKATGSLTCKVCTLYSRHVCSIAMQNAQVGRGFARMLYACCLSVIVHAVRRQGHARSLCATGGGSPCQLATACLAR